MPISLVGVDHIYRRGEPDETRALRDISLSVGEKEFVLIAGRNGSGKSTLLQCMAGLQKPSSGKVTIDDKAASVSRDRIAFAVQFPERALFERKLYDDVAFGPRNRGVSEDNIQSLVGRAMDAVGLDKALLSLSPGDLSHGQKRLAALAGIIVTGPKYLFLDEPTAGLDGPGRARILSTLARLNEGGTAVIVASHDLAHMMAACNRMIILMDGSIVADVPPRELLSMEHLESMGLSLPYPLAAARGLRRRGIPVEDWRLETLADGIRRMCEHENTG